MESTLAAGSVEDLFAALNRRDYDSVSAFFADEVTLAGAEPTVLRGLQAVIEHFQQSDALLPDSSLALGDVLTGEAKLGVEFVLRGTQSGDLDLGAERGIAPASGRSAAVPAFWSMSVSHVVPIGPPSGHAPRGVIR